MEKIINRHEVSSMRGKQREEKMEPTSCFQVLLKPMLNDGKRKTL
jgi:hypothetical protein